MVYFLENISDPVFHLHRQIHKYVTDFLLTVNEPLEGVYSDGEYTEKHPRFTASLVKKQALNYFVAYQTTEINLCEMSA